MTVHDSTGVVHVDAQRVDFGSSDPAASLRVGGGVRVRFRTTDEQYVQMARYGDLSRVTAPRNPVTGPIECTDARVGDVLAVTVEDVQFDGHGWIVSLPGRGALATRMGDRLLTRRVPIEEGSVRLGDQIDVPIRPMIGCLGLAPANGYAGTMAPAVPTGGNLDIPDVGVGATVYLPVQVDGAWFALGDLHAVMARGEATFVAVEAPGTATVSIRLLRNEHLARPRIATVLERISVGLGDPVNAAVETAMVDLFDWVTRDFEIDKMDLYALMSAEAHTELGGPVGSEAPDMHGRSRGAVTLARLASRTLASVPRRSDVFDPVGRTG